MNLTLKIKILESKKPQIYLSHEMGIPEPHLSKIVNGWINPKPELKEKFAKVLGCRVEEVFPIQG